MGATRRALLKVWKYLPAKRWYERYIFKIISPSFNVGLVAVVNDAEGRVMLARHTYRRRWPWGFPGGTLERGEQIDDCIVREIREETALVAEPLGLVGVDVLENYGRIECVMRLRIVAGSFEPSDEVSEVRFFARGEFPELSPEQNDFVARYEAELFTPGTWPQSATGDR